MIVVLIVMEHQKKKQLIAKNVIIKMDIIMSKEKRIPYVEVNQR